jgi:hypothetical protein
MEDCTGLGSSRLSLVHRGRHLYQSGESVSLDQKRYAIMAIVRNLGNPSQPIDKSYTIPNRVGVVAPATPQYAGEIVTGVPVTGYVPGGYVATSLDVNSWVSYSFGGSVGPIV